MNIAQRLILVIGALALCAAFVIEPYKVERVWVGNGDSYGENLLQQAQQGKYVNGVSVQWIEYHFFLKQPLRESLAYHDIAIVGEGFYRREIVNTYYDFRQKATDVFLTEVGVIVVAIAGLYFLFKSVKKSAKNSTDPSL